MQPLAARERMELILSQLDRLPTLPAIAVRLLSLTSADDSSARDVVELIKSDAALTAAILRLVRRADLGVPDRVTTVERAVPLLGFSLVRNAVFSVQLYEALSQPEANRRASETRKGIWQHSLAVACTAEAVAVRVGGPALGGEAFVCGLLHDVGKMALDACLPKSYARVVERVEQRHACICDVERELFGLDHTVAGKRLATRWRLPQAVVECVWLHHHAPDTLPSTVAFGQLVGVVHLADNVVRRDGIGYSGYQHVGDVETLANQVGVDGAGLAVILEQLPARMEPFRELLGLDDLRSRSEYAASLAVVNRRLSMLNADLKEAERRLEIRSRWLAAFADFTRRLGDGDRISDVCVSAAESVRAMLGVEKALAFCAETTGRCIHVGVAGANDREHGASVIDLGESHNPLGLETPFPAPPSRTFAPAPEVCESVWHRCMRTSPSDRLWLLPLAADEAMTAAVLIPAPDDVVRRLQSAAAECQAWSQAVGLAIKSAKTRIESERMSEELLDLTRRLRATQEELVRARSISMIAAMAAGAAHELNGPLSVVSGRAQMELAKCTDEESARAFKIIIEQVQRAAQIVTDLMAFAKPDPPSPVLLPLADLLHPICQHWRASSSLRDDQLTVHLADEKVSVYADGNRLREILDAVIANALEATRPETARLHINSPSRASDETVRITVEDNGAGMTREVLEHAIDPFFSHRPAGRGRGLGLSRAYRLAEIQGGRLWLESEPNVGTKVTIELPARPPGS